MGVPTYRGLTHSDGFEPSYALAAKHEIQRIPPAERRLLPCPLIAELLIHYINICAFRNIESFTRVLDPSANR